MRSTLGFFSFAELKRYFYICRKCFLPRWKTFSTWV